MSFEKLRQATIPCPHCGEQANASASNTWRPFCSRRCKLIDLGDWLTEEHRIAGKPAEHSGLDESDLSGSSHH